MTYYGSSRVEHAVTRCLASSSNTSFYIRLPSVFSFLSLAFYTPLYLKSSPEEPLPSYLFSTVAFTPMAYSVTLVYSPKFIYAKFRLCKKVSSASKVPVTTLEGAASSFCTVWKVYTFLNNEVIYRVTNKNHNGKTKHTSRCLLFLKCRSIITRRCSLRGLREVRCRLRSSSHDERRYVLCVIHMDFVVFSKVNHDQTMFCVVYVDFNVLSKVKNDQKMVCPVHVDDARLFLQGQSWPNDVLLSLRGWWCRLRGLSWSDDVLCVVNVGDDVFAKVNHDQIMFFTLSTWTWTFSPRSIMCIRRCSAQSMWTITSSLRSSITGRSSA